MVRFKNRYFLCELESQQKLVSIVEKDIAESLRDIITVQYGDFGIGLVRPSLSGNFVLVDVSLLM